MFLRALTGGLLLTALMTLTGCIGSVDESTLPVHSRGGENTTVVVQKFSDFQCRACAVHSTTTTKRILDEFGENISFEFRHYPLMRIHPQAELAAIAAEAAGVQGKFWAMHDILYLNQAAWSNNSNARDLFITYAEQLELDMPLFQQELGNRLHRSTVARDIRLGNLLPVEGTPTYVVNGVKVVPQTNLYDDIRAAIVAAQQETPTAE